MAPTEEHWSRSPSCLETLPTELCEIIFLESMNFDMPAASLRLAQSLRSKRLYLEVTHRVLYEPFHWLDQSQFRHILDRKDIHFRIEHGKLQWESCTKEPHGVYPDKTGLKGSDWRTVRSVLLQSFRFLDWGGCRQPTSQSRLLECRFFTWQTFSDLIKQSHASFLDEFKQAKALDFFQLAPRSEFGSYQPLWWSKFSVESIMTAFEDFDFRYNPARWSQPEPKLAANLGWGSHWFPPWLHFKKEALLPAKLLRRPWPRDKQMLLFWLLNPSPIHHSQTTGGVSTLGREPGRLEKLLTDAVKDNIDWLAEICVLQAKVPVTTRLLRQALNPKDEEAFPFNIVSTILYTIYHGIKLRSEKLVSFDAILEESLLQREADEDLISKNLDRSSKLFSSISRAKWTRAHAAKWKERTEEDDENDDPKEPTRPYSSEYSDMRNLLDEYDLDYMDFDDNGKIEDVPEDSRLHEVLMIDIRSDVARAHG